VAVSTGQAVTAVTERLPQAEPLSRPDWRERALAWRDNLLRQPAFQRWAARFPLTRPIARRRARALFDICAGFVYSQTLFACLELDLFTLLAGPPLTLTEVSVRTGLDEPATERLLRAAMSLRLVEPRQRDRFGLGPLGAPLVGNMALRSLVEHHALFYDDLRDPVGVLRRNRRGATAISQYFAYASADEPRAIRLERAAPYSALMAATIAPLTHEILDAYSLESHRCLMDVGGGEGVFVREVARRYPDLALMVFELPAVAALAASRLAADGLSDRVALHCGSFHTEALPGGADLITLIRVLLDHGDDAALDILRRVRAALPRGGVVLIAEPMAGLKGTEVVGDAYFGFYLAAMGAGRARRPAELQDLLHRAGFSSSSVLKTRYPLNSGLIAATR
jgi:demethylspheroidene O-methyltransferase